jgi:predicted GNAT family acetyltransferase
MFVSFEADDRVLDSKEFMQAEVQYNLIHLIAGNKESLKIKASGNDLIFAHSAGHNPWLWVSAGLEPEQRKTLVQQLAVRLKGHELSGITGEPDTARLFAETWCESTGQLYHTHMMMEAYYCPQVLKPPGVSGQLVQPDDSYTALISEYLSSFVEDAFGTVSPAENHLGYARSIVQSGKLHLWIAEDKPVSMANLAHLSARHGRINEVFTPREHRKHGYASACVAELCARMLDKGITPVLYADSINPDSNKVYQSIGFVNAGRVADLRFD